MTNLQINLSENLNFIEIYLALDQLTLDALLADSNEARLLYEKK